MSWGDVTFDADLVAKVFRDLDRAPALHAGNVELGKSNSDHQIMIAVQKPPPLAKRKQRRFRLNSAQCLGRSGPAKDSTRAVVEFRGHSVELVLGERGQVGGFVQVLAQQCFR